MQPVKEEQQANVQQPFRVSSSGSRGPSVPSVLLAWARYPSWRRYTEWQLGTSAEGQTGQRNEASDGFWGQQEPVCSTACCFGGGGSPPVSPWRPCRGRPTVLLLHNCASTTKQQAAPRKQAPNKLSAGGFNPALKPWNPGSTCPLKERNHQGEFLGKLKKTETWFRSHWRSDRLQHLELEAAVHHRKKVKDSKYKGMIWRFKRPVFSRWFHWLCFEPLLQPSEIEIRCKRS